MKVEIIELDLQDIVMNTLDNYRDILGDMKSEGVETFETHVKQMDEIVSVVNFDNEDKLIQIRNRFKEGLTFLMVSSDQKALLEELDNASEPFILSIKNGETHLGFILDKDVVW